MVVGEVASQDASQVFLVEDDDVIVELRSLTMPPSDGRWLDDDQRRAPVTPEPGHQGSEDAITWLHPRSLDGAAQDGQLLAQREILSDQDGSALDEDSKQAKKGLQD